jgi:DNA-directed RNA polymerase specialized sigma24 family protein
MTSRDPDRVSRDADGLRASDKAIREQAVGRIWRRFEPHLLEAVTHQFNPKTVLAGECDIVQNMFNKFIDAAHGADSSSLASRDDAWKFLVWMAMCRVASAVTTNEAPGSDARPRPEGANEVSDQQLSCMMADLQGHGELEAKEAAIPREQFERLLGRLPEELQRIFVWKLENRTNGEVARLINRTERTVELKLKILRKILVRLVIPG